MISISLWRLQGSNTGLLLPTTSSNYPDLAWVHSSFVGMCFKSTTMHSMKCRSLKWLPKAAHQTRLTPLCMWKNGVCGSIECIELRVSYIYIYILYIYYPVYHTLLAYIIIMSLSDVQVRKWYWRVNMFWRHGVFSQKGKNAPHFLSCKKILAAKKTPAKRRCHHFYPTTDQTAKVWACDEKIRRCFGPKIRSLTFPMLS